MPVLSPPRRQAPARAAAPASFFGLVDDRLATGASYALEELVRYVQRTDDEVTGDLVRRYCEQLVADGKAARIPAGDTVRYQRRVAPRRGSAS